MSKNIELSRLMARTAQVMEVFGVNRFKVVAYQRAARALEDLPDDVASLVESGQITKIDGIGKGLAEKITEYVNTGNIDEIDQLMSQVPPGVVAMLDIPGLGPKTVALIWHEANVDSLDELKVAIADGRLTKLKGLGPKRIENISKNLEFVSKSKDRVRLGAALPIAMWTVNQLSKIKAVKEVTYAGSLRRGRDTIGDVDLLVAADPKHAKAIGEAFIELAPKADILAQGETKTSIRTPDGLQIDLRIVEPDSFGAALMYFTGSKEHNVRLRERAIKKGLRLNEYGLFEHSDGETGKRVAGTTEQEVYAALDLPWIPPELREDRGELAKAEAGDLPRLLEEEQIAAELHAHTTASDGKLSIRELAELAIAHGYHTIAVTDHSKSQVIANGLSDERLEAHIAAVRAVASEMKDRIAVLAGSEVDILADGSLDYPDSLLAELDIVVASPHASLSQDPGKATKRLLKAIESPYVSILGHPTGRIVNRREGLSPDMKALIEAARDRGIAMEINANPARLDLRDSHAKAAVEAGVKLAINTDAHHPDDMDLLTFGVLTARRAGASADDVVNCMSREALGQWIEGTRG